MITSILPILHYAEESVFVLLFALSVWSIGVMIDRRRMYKHLADIRDMQLAEGMIRKDDSAHLSEWSSKKGSIFAGIMNAILEAPANSEQIETAARGYILIERQKFEKGLGILATLGSNAPFIGLFGTVLGIIEAFSALSTEQAASSTVMASIAQALIATAIGLFVAIPAVVGYNYFSGRLRNTLANCEALKNLYLSRLKGAR